jgi:hypothetical protein
LPHGRVRVGVLLVRQQAFADLVKWSISRERGPVHGGAALGCAALGGDALGGDWLGGDGLGGDWLGGDGLGGDWLGGDGRGGDGLGGDGLGGDGRRRILLLHRRQGSVRTAVGVFSIWRS